MTTWESRDEVRGFAPHNGRTTPAVIVRRWYEDGTFRRADVFVGGRRVGTYKTGRGALRRADNETA